MTNMIELQTYRFSFGKEFSDELYGFSKIHQFDDRKDFKEAWASWIEETEIKSLIHLEMKQLSHDGYIGDILDKMFKSARYYYRKKPLISSEQPERKLYVGFPKDLLAEMDEDIKKQIASGYLNGKNKNKLIEISPSLAFDTYCINHKMTILNELKNEASSDKKQFTNSDVEGITNRFKKAYKNRFYKIRVQIQGYREPTVPL